LFLFDTGWNLKTSYITWTTWSNGLVQIISKLKYFYFCIMNNLKNIFIGTKYHKMTETDEYRFFLQNMFTKEDFIGTWIKIQKLLLFEIICTHTHNIFMMTETGTCARKRLILIIIAPSGYTIGLAAAVWLYDRPNGLRLAIRSA
jgi:hypothetical protein